MRNLVITHQAQHAVDLGAGDAEITQICCNSLDGLLYAATDVGTVICLTSAECRVQWRVALSPEGPSPEPVAVVGFTWVLELEALSIGLASGELLLVHAATRAVEEVGFVSGGLAAVAWSPDGELVAAASSSGNLLLMSKDWEPLAEMSIPGYAPALDGEALAGISIAWRGDGKFFATSSPVEGRVRCVHVWERDECRLHATGEAAAGLAAPLAWQPNCRHLYGVQGLVPEQLRQLQEKEARHPRQLMAYTPPGADNGAGATPAGAPAPADVGAPAMSAAAGAECANLLQRVVLFETNGLQHGGFMVPCGHGGRVHTLSWSQDSQLLALVVGPAASGNEDGPASRDAAPWAVQVWHRSNWHWYMKHACAYPIVGRRPPLAVWDDQAPMRLHVATAGGHYHTTAFVWDVCVSARGTACVVDGARLLITPFRHGIVPPPMCAVTAEGSAAIGCCAVAEDGVGEAVALALSGGRLGLLRCVEADLWEETLEEQQEAGDSRSSTLLVAEPPLVVPLAEGRSLKALTWMGPGRLLAVAAPFPERQLEEGEGDVLVEVAVQLPSTPGGDCSAEEVGSCYVGGSVLRAVSHAVASTSGRGGDSEDAQAPPPAPNAALLQLSDGTLLLFTSGGGLQRLGSAAAFPSPCPHMWPLPPGVVPKPGAPAVGLSPAGELCWGARQLATGVVSAALRAAGPGGAALLYTSRQDLLYTVPCKDLGSYSHQQADFTGRHDPQRARQYPGDLKAAMQAAMRPAGAAMEADMSVRAVEQGARLVAVPQGGTEAVLQMPRGNLEAVSPRLLVLLAAALDLRAGRYAHAWELINAQRLDFNLLVDLDWPDFLDRAASFVEAVPSADDLCTLLMALQPTSVLAPGGLYSALPAHLPPSAVRRPAAAGVSSGLGADKVAAACAAIRAAASAPEYAARRAGDALTVVATSYARSSPPDLEAALRAIKAAKDAADAAPDPLATSAAADAALRHLLLYADADALYGVALGMYDLALAFMVVRHAQKDPAEYLSELQGFAAVQDENLRRHRIDLHLRRWEAALAHLVDAGPEHFPDALALARERGLLRRLLELCRGDAGTRRTVLAAYGEQLGGSRRHEDAAVAFLASGQLLAAMDAYREAGAWRMAMVIAARLGWEEGRVQALAAELADQAASAGAHGDAATLLLQYLGDVDSAVLHLTQGAEWREALRLAHAHVRSDLVDTLVVPGAAAAAAALVSDADESTGKLAKYRARLAEVRARRQAMQAALSTTADADGAGEAWEDDVVSEAPSVIGGLSMYTDRTGATALTSSSAVSSAHSASTIGLRPPQRKGSSKGKRGRIKQGGAAEEADLARHLARLAPAAHVLDQAGQLGEVLCLLGHYEDAVTLQRRVSAWQQAAREAEEDVRAHPPPSVPGHQEAAAAVPAAQGSVKWKWEVLRSAQ